MTSILSEPLCACIGIKRESTTKARRSLLPGLAFFARRGVYSTHRSGCAFYRNGDVEATMSVGVELNFAISSALSSLIELSLSLTRGAGGSALAGLSYRCRNVVRRSAPAFSLIARCFFFETNRQYGTIHSFVSGSIEKSRRMSTMERVRRFNETERELLRLFHQRLAFPDDVNPSGDTVLSVSLNGPVTKY